MTWVGGRSLGGLQEDRGFSYVPFRKRKGMTEKTDYRIKRKTSIWETRLSVIDDGRVDMMSKGGVDPSMDR